MLLKDPEDAVTSPIQYCSLYPESTFDWVNVVILSQQKHPIFHKKPKTKTMLMITETACRSDIGTFNFVTYTASMNKERF